MYEFDPDERNGPYHYELGNEERLLVLAGTPTLRHPEGRDRSGTWSCSPKGRDSAHQLINESAAVTRLLIRQPCESHTGARIPTAASSRPWVVDCWLSSGPRAPQGPAWATARSRERERGALACHARIWRPASGCAADAWGCAVALNLVRPPPDSLPAGASLTPSLPSVTAIARLPIDCSTLHEAGPTTVLKHT
jgi:hypothetical protein